MAQRAQQMHTRPQIELLCNASEIAIAAVLGSAGGIGKTTIADVFSSFLEAHGVAVQMVRVETAVRRREFARRDIVIDLDGAADAAHGLGGEAAIFEDAWPRVEAAIKGRGTVFSLTPAPTGTARSSAWRP